MQVSVTVLEAVYVFCLGLCVGSFLQLLVQRLPQELPLLRGRTGCDACGVSFGLWRGLPLLGFCLRKGRCPACGQKQSRIAPVIELGTGLLFFFLLLKYGMGWQLLLMAAAVSLLICIAAIDFLQMEIYTVMVVLLGALGLTGVLLFDEPTLRSRLLGALFGFGVFFIIYIVAKLVYGREGFGLGDVYLMGALGALLGTRDTFIAGMFSFYIAAVALLLLKLLGRRLTLRQEVPFGPYICGGALVAIFWGDALTNLYLSVVVRL